MYMRILILAMFTMSFGSFARAATVDNGETMVSILSTLLEGIDADKMKPQHSQQIIIPRGQPRLDALKLAGYTVTKIDLRSGSGSNGSEICLVTLSLHGPGMFNRGPINRKPLATFQAQLASEFVQLDDVLRSKCDLRSPASSSTRSSQSRVNDSNVKLPNVSAQ